MNNPIDWVVWFVWDPAFGFGLIIGFIIGLVEIARSSR